MCLHVLVLFCGARDASFKHNEDRSFVLLFLVLRMFPYAIDGLLTDQQAM